MGFVDVCERLTDLFEKKNLGREWDGEFYDEIDAFVDSYVRGEFEIHGAGTKKPF